MDRENTAFYRPVRNALVAFLVIGSIFLIAKTVAAAHGWKQTSGGTENQPHIVVNGKGEVEKKPDIATFSFTVQEDGTTVKDAQDKATVKTNKALDYLKSVGIAEKDIKTLGYNTNPKYEYQTIVCIRYPCPQGKQTIVGYEASQTVEVKVRDTEKAGTILAAIGGYNVQNISSLTFTFDNEDLVVAEARQKAINDAKEKATALAKQLGVRIVRITDFQESGSYPQMYYAKDMAATSGAANQSAPAPELPTGENKITSNVTITFEIR
jgi:uncharacterized protein YggE